MNAYRRAIDLYYANGKPAPNELLDELQKSATRPYTNGFFFGHPENAGVDAKRETVPRRYTFVARVLGSAEDDCILVEQRNKFAVGDMLEVLSPDMHSVSFTVTSVLTLDGEERRDAPHAQEILRLKCPVKLRGGELLRRLDAGRGADHRE